MMSEVIVKFETLVTGVEQCCSDIHITAGTKCFCRTDGRLMPVMPEVTFTGAELELLIDQMLKENEKNVFQEKNAVDLAYEVYGRRLRISVYRQKGKIALAVRLINDKIPSIESEDYPDILKHLALKDKGLVLVTGPAGSGKSTTLAAMLSYRAKHCPSHIITLEDPIEYLFVSSESLIHQREYGSDFYSFEEALKSAMRQDPDMILIGEIRDQETLQAALRAAQTGHLVLSTLHTSGAVDSLIRIESMFAGTQQEAVRMELSMTLQGIVSQKLLAKKGGGRICAMEIMTATEAVRNLIVTGQPQQIMTAIQTGRNSGMQTLEMSLSDLRCKGFID